MALMSQPLEYKNPRTPEIPQSLSVYEALLNREQGANTRIHVQWIAGFCGLLLTSVIVALVLAPIRLGPAYWWIAASITIALIFFSFYAEQQTRGQYVDLSPTGNSDPAPGIPLSPGVSWGGRSPRISRGAYLEIFAWGPLQMRLATEKAAALRKLDHINRRRAAEILSAMLATTRDITFDQLQFPRESPQQFLDLLAYLHTHDWIGINLDRRIAWVRSQVRPSLGASS